MFQLFHFHRIAGAKTLGFLSTVLALLLFYGHAFGQPLFQPKTEGKSYSYQGKPYSLTESKTKFIVRFAEGSNYQPIVQEFKLICVYRAEAEKKQYAEAKPGMPLDFMGEVAKLPATLQIRNAAQASALLRSKPGVNASSPYVIDPASKVEQAYTNQLILKLTEGTQLMDVKKNLVGFGVDENSYQTTLMDRTFTARVAKNQDLMEVLQTLQRIPYLAYAEPDFLKFLKPNNDPIYPNQWSLNNLGSTSYPGATVDADIDAPEAWNISRGSAAVKVAVLDEGVELTHPDLQPNLVQGFDACGLNTTGQCDAVNPHGTACSGIIAAVDSNGIGIRGVAPKCKIMPVRIAYRAAGGSWVTSDTWIGNALTWAYTNGAWVLSNSWGGGSPSTTITSAIQNATTIGRGGLGSLVIFSAGNSNLSSAGYPSNTVEAVSVVAMSMCDQRKSTTSCDGETFWGSNYGTGVDVSAPGVKINTTDNLGTGGYNSTDYYDSFNGTSSACPHVSGVAALIFSAAPTLSYSMARLILERSCDKTGGYAYSANASQPNGTWSTELGYGRINAYNALRLATNAVMAGFTSNIQYSITVPVTINFQNTSLNGVSYEWSFPGGNPSSSTATNPSVTYTAFGNYNVQLIATATNGTKDTLLVPNFIRISPDLVMSQGSVSTCNAFFYDEGGSVANYGNNSSKTFTINSNVTNGKVTVQFLSFATETGSDILRVYDGPTTASPLLGTYSGTTLPPTLMSSHVSGALTFNFTSTSSTTFAGWQAQITCFVPGPPTIASFSPTTVFRGSVVNLTGTNFTGITSLKFNNASVTNYTINSLTSIKATVPLTATTGPIQITTGTGSFTTTTNLIVDTTVQLYCTPVNPSCTGGDYITNFSIQNTTLNNNSDCSENADGSAYSIYPASGSTTATLKKGKPYTFSTTFNGDQLAFWIDYDRNGSFDASEYSLVTASTTSGTVSITVTIPNTAATGLTGLRLRSRSASFGSGDACAAFGSGETEDYFIKLEPNTSPYITSFTPNFGPVGTPVTVTGANFTGLTSLKFNGTAAAFTVVSATQLTTTVPVGATTGHISVASPLGTDTSAGNFYVGSQPPPKVLIIYATDAPTNPYYTDVKAKIEATGAFYQVDGFNAYVATPTVSLLMDYRAILVYCNYGWSDRVQLGNVLASYMQAGGGVVSGMFNHGSTNSTSRLEGNFIPYELIPYLANYQSGTDLSVGTRFIPNHPLLKDVITFQGGMSYRPNSLAVNAGSLRVADWTDGTPLIVAKEYTSPTRARKVDLGMWPTSSDGYPSGGWNKSTDGAKILRNALLWVMGADTLPYITSFDPGMGLANDLVSVVGNNLANASVVKFNATTATQVLSVTDTLVKVRVPVGATSGKITITTPKGTAESATPFIVGSEVPMFNGQLSLCSGKVTDSGGSTGLYGNNETLVFTLNPNTAGAFTRLTFSKFRTQTGDRLEIYNGSSISATLLGSYQGTSLPPVVTATNTTGSLTLRFISNSSLTDSGFVATISCFIPPAPQVLSFTPTQGSSGTFVTILGRNFINVNSVQFNGTSATGYTVVDTGRITVTVPFGTTTGKILVTTGTGTGLSAANFTIVDPNFNCIPVHPACSGGYLSNISISATSLNNTTACTSVTAPAFSIYAPIGSATCSLSVGAAYNLSVTTTGGSQIVSAWIDLDRDSIFEPSEWYQLTTSSVSGTPNVVQITIPSTTVPGPILFRVRSRDAGNSNGSGDACTTFGSGEGEQYTLTILPDIYPRVFSFTPTVGVVGTVVTINGKRLQNASSVKFNQVAATFNQVTDTTLTATVPAMATSGPITITTPLGTATSLTSFVVKRPGRPNILLLHTFGGSDANALDVKAKLEAVYPFSGIDIINGNQVTPSLAELQQYEAVLVWNVYAWADRVTLGNNLASYINGGGRVVGGIYATGGSSGSNPGGTYSSFELIPFGSSTSSANMSMATPLLPNHAILKGVSSFQGGTSGARPSTTSVASGAIRVANWTAGNPLIVVSNSLGTASVRKVDLGFCPVSSDVVTYGWNVTTGGAKLLRNALLWVTDNESYIDSLFAIESFNPGSGAVGTPVLVKGKRFNGVSELKFNGTQAVFSVVNDSLITTTVPAGAQSGKITANRGVDVVSSPLKFIVGDTLLMQNTSYTTCSGLIASSQYGSGSGGYGNNETYIVTLYPATSGAKLRLSFQAFQTESGGDYLRVYDGTTTSATQLGAFSGSSIPSAVLATNPAGALTLMFSSNSNFTYSGFLGRITCVSPNGPVISLVTPYIGATGASITITGTNLANATSLKFNGIAAGIANNTATSLTTVVPVGASTGYVSVTTAEGTSESPFTFVVCSDFTTTPLGADTVVRCGTGSVSLSASGAPAGSTYRWFSSATNTSYLVQSSVYSPSVSTTTTYYVAYYNSSTGCIGARKPVVAKVNAVPNAQFTGLQSAYCLNDAPSTLVPVIPGGAFTNATGNQFVPASVGVGNVSVSYSVTVNGCPATTSQTTTVRALPNANYVGLKASYCQNEGASTLTPTVSGGTFTGSTLLTGNQFNPTQTGTYTIRYTVSQLGCSNFLEKTTVVNPGANAEFSGLLAEYCKGAMGSILVPEVAGGTFTGTGVLNNSFTPTVVGPITITYTLAGSPCPGVATHTTIVAPVPTATFTANGGSLTSTTAGTGLTYQWLLNGSALPLATTATFTASQSGSYQLVASLGNCPDTSVIQVITDDLNNVVGTDQFELFPNPTTNAVWIKSKSGSPLPVQIWVTNALGQEMRIVKEHFSKKETMLSFRQVANGLYFVRVTQGTLHHLFTVRKE